MGWGLRVKKLNIMGVHWKIWFLGRVHEKANTQWGLSKKGALGQFADLRGALAKGVVVLRGVDIPIHTMSVLHLLLSDGGSWTLLFSYA